MFEIKEKLSYYGMKTVGTDKVRIQSKVKHGSDMLNQLIFDNPENLIQYRDTDPDRETGVTILIPWRNAQSLWISGVLEELHQLWKGITSGHQIGQNRRHRNDPKFQKYLESLIDVLFTKNFHQYWMFHGHAQLRHCRVDCKFIYDAIFNNIKLPINIKIFDIKQLANPKFLHYVKNIDSGWNCIKGDQIPHNHKKIEKIEYDILKSYSEDRRLNKKDYSNFIDIFNIQEFLQDDDHSQYTKSIPDICSVISGYFAFEKHIDKLVKELDNWIDFDSI